MTISTKHIIVGTYLSLLTCSLAFAEVAIDRLQQEETFTPSDFATGEPRDLDAESAAAQSALKQKQPIRIDLEAALARAKPVTRDATAGANERQISIAETRAMALRNNLSLEIASIDPLIAETRVGEERAKFDNIIFANVKRSNESIPTIGGDIVKFSSLNPELDDEQVKLSKIEQDITYLDGDLGLTIPLRTGGTVTLSTPFERKRTGGELGTDEYRRATRFSISQPLLRGAGVAVNEASIRVAEFEKQAVDARTRLQSIRVLSLIDKAYWEVYAAWAELDVRYQQYNNANQNLAMVRRRVEEGLSARIEASRAEIGVANRIEALIIAETNLKLSQRQLRLMLNDQDFPLDSTVNLVPVTSPSLVNYDFDREKLVAEAMANRLELLDLELKLAADLQNIVYLENQTLPLFTLDYSYGALSASSDSLGQAYNNPFDNRFNRWSLGLRFELPMTNEARRMQLQRAIQQRLQRLTTKTLQELTVEREIYDVLDQVEQNWQRISAARQQVILAGYNYEAELKQFREGLRTMTEVLEMLSALGESQVKEIRAIADYQASLIDLAYATGTLLGYSRVEF